LSLESSSLSSGTTPTPHHFQADFITEGRDGDVMGTPKPFKFMPKLYTAPVIRRFKDKWYVEYYFSNPFFGKEHGQKEFERFKVYEDINHFKGDEKEEYAQKLCESVAVRLEAGYDPFKEIEKTYNRKLKKIEREKYLQSEAAKGRPIIILLDLYMDAKIKEGITAKSIQSYTTPINHFKKWLISKNWTERGVKEFTEIDLKEWLTYMQKENKWTGRTYNSNMDYMIMWFKWFEWEKYIDQTPLTGRIKRQKTVSVKNEYYNQPIRSIVKNALKEYPLLNWACEFVYYAAVRSFQELSRIRIGDIDLPNRVIKIKEHVGKKGYRFIPMCDELYDLLLAKNLDRYKLDDFLFGKYGEINNIQMDKNYLSRRYAKVRDKLKIGQEYTIYGWKHTRVVDLKNEGYTDAEIQNLTGHTDSKSYDAYSRNFGLSLATKLKGKTIQF
jgi:integrase